MAASVSQRHRHEMVILLVFNTIALGFLVLFKREALPKKFTISHAGVIQDLLF
jgi:hypothetical protein